MFKYSTLSPKNKLAEYDGHSSGHLQGGTREGGFPEVAGLSTVHISPRVIERKAKMEFWIGGSLVRVTSGRTKLSDELGTGGKRGVISGYSWASRRRFMRLAAMVRNDIMPVFVTLTYPGEFPLNPAEWKRHLDIFVKRMVRKWRVASGFWKLEPQKRGAPHFHLLLWGVDYWDLKRYVGETWYQVVGSGDNRHLRAGTRVEQIREPGGIMFYASKYLGKVVQVPEEYKKLWKHVGRWWGVINRRALQFVEPVTCDISPKKAFEVIRLLKRYAHIRNRRALKSLTIICHAEKWFDRLDLADPPTDPGPISILKKRLAEYIHNKNP